MSSLRDRTGKALAWDLLGNYGGQISSFVISIFLARLLEPEEFGLVGMSMVFIAVLQIFKDMGFASALIQSKNNTSLTYSSIFYLNVFAGILLTGIIYLSAPLIGDFYENNKITEIVRLLSITFFISSFNIVQSTILRRELDFKKLTFRDLLSQLIAGIVAIIFAWNGFGVYALVIQQIVAAIIQTILLWKITDWYPKLEFSWLEVKSLSGFSLYVFAAQSINTIIKQADTLIIGKLFSPSTLGFFSRANSLNGLINKNATGSITKVFFPALATIQDDNEKFQRVYLKIINIASGFTILLTGVFFLSGQELIIGLFGKKWEPSVLIFQILIIQGFTMPINSMIVNAFMAKGKSKENFHIGNFRKLFRLIPLGVAYFYGFYPFLYATVGVSIFNWLLNNWFVTYKLNIPYILQIKSVLPYLILGIILIVVNELFDSNDFDYFVSFVKSLVFIIIYLTILYLNKSELTTEGLYYAKRIWIQLKKF